MTAPAPSPELQQAVDTPKRSWLSHPESWVYLAGVPAGLAFVLIVLPFLAPSVLDLFDRLAEWLNPSMDAPDNWAMALTYYFRVLILLGAAASGCLGVSGLKWWNSRRPV
jgi:hypothetical protein